MADFWLPAAIVYPMNLKNYPLTFEKFLPKNPPLYPPCVRGLCTCLELIKATILEFC